MSEAAEPKPTGLALLRVPFAANHISKLPKPTKAQTDAVKADYKKGIRCKECGAWHHPDVVHLDYVGHAALTDRLLDCDPEWTWEPVAFNQGGLPATDNVGGMWIKLTVCGVSRLGYGHAEGKNGGDAVKEIIGDALRNAAMRFGAALDLWHKGDLHAIEEPETDNDKANTNRSASKKPTMQERLEGALQAVANEKTTDGVQKLYERTAGLRSELDKVDRIRLEQALTDRVSEIEGNDPFGGGK